MSASQRVRLLLAASLAGLSPGDIGQASQDATGPPRRPLALVIQGERLLVGNGRSGTISVVDLQRGQVVAEHRVAGRIADMSTADESTVLLLAADSDRLLQARLSGSAVQVREVTRLPRGVNRLVFDRAVRTAFVTSTWSRHLTALKLDADLRTVVTSQQLELPFAPRDLVLVPAAAGTPSERPRLVAVAAAFGDQLAVVDAESLVLRGLRRVPGHNLRGLAVTADGRQLLVGHQQLAQRRPADYEELHWGRLVQNGVQFIDTSSLLEPAGAERVVVGWLDAQGGIGAAMGDPSGVVCRADGTTAVAFGGVGEIALRQRGVLRRIRVGRRPEAMLFHGEKLVVANRFDDSLSVIDLASARVEATVSLGTPPPLSARDRGELLFYDARLSHDGWMSCHSCHTDGHGADLLVDTLGDGDYGAPKRVPSLLATGDTGPWSWIGSVASLEEQVRRSVETTMHGEVSDGQVADLAAFLRSLAPPPASPVSADVVNAGRRVFLASGCVQCHAEPAWTSGGVFDVGLADEQGRRQFNPPSLRGVGHRARLFHDGRARSLEEVLTKYGHQLSGPLSPEELLQLVQYLRSL